MPLYLPMPRDRRLQAICQALLKQPELGLTLDDWGLRVGASSRTLARLFAQELQMSFHEWRQQLRLTEALPRLLAGDSVQVVARDLGYGSTRAFSSMFRRLLGETRATTWGDWSNWHGSGAARTDSPRRNAKQPRIGG